MAASKSGVELLDYVSEFSLGMNAGLQPLLLPRNQLAFALNTTIRGGYAKNRPPIFRNLTIEWESDDVREAVQHGLFQGACYYSPDSGPQCLMASISGRLYQFQINGNVVTVTDVSIPGDPNPSATTQVWMWQSERWVIVNDGLNLPIFYDGVYSRRSAGPSVLLASASAASSDTPEIGDTFDLTIDVATWPGPYDTPVLFHGEYYQAVNVDYVYHAKLTTLYDATGGHLENDRILVQPALVGYFLADTGYNVNSTSVPAGAFVQTFNLTGPFQGAIGTLVSITGAAFQPGYASTPFVNGQTIIWRITAKSGNTITVTNQYALYSGARTIVGFWYDAGTSIQVSGSVAPNTVAAILTQDLPVTPIGTETIVTIRDYYNGISGQVVYIGGAQFLIEAAVTTPATVTPNTVKMMNLTDASGVTLDFTNPLPIMSVPELPAGRMGAYGMGQNWMSLVDGFSFIVSDISRGPSGTQAYDYRDAVLKTTELTFVGGSFAIPSSGSPITSMTFTAKMDESLGQGPLQIGTNTAIFSINAPFNFADPPPLNTPILPEVLKGQGPLAQNSTVLVNSDTFFRSSDGLASFIQARRDFTSWGNTGISDEVNDRILDNDDQSLLPYGSSIVFDNRFLTTCGPLASSNGVIHRGIIAINLDPVSSLAGKSSAKYDGLWTGLNALQLLVGLFGGESRAFAFGYNTTTLKIELYELLPTKTEIQFDNEYIPITWAIETAAIFNSDVKPNEQLIRLQDGEFAVDLVQGRVFFNVFYRFDTGCWIPWHEFSICAASGASPQSYPRLGLGQPSADNCNTVLQTPSREGYALQVRFQITGRCRFLRARFKAVTIDSPEYQEPICNAGCT